MDTKIKHAQPGNLAKCILQGFTSRRYAMALALLLAGFVSAPRAFAEVVTYQFTGTVWDAPAELIGLVNDPLAFSMTVDTSIPPDDTSAQAINNSAEYSNSILSLSVKLGATTIATADSGRAGITDYFGYDGQSVPKDYFQVTANTNSAPVLGLTPLSLYLNLISYDLNTVTSTGWPTPFPSPLQFTDTRLLYVQFSGGRQLGFLLNGVTTTSPTPLPASVWLLGSVLVGLWVMRRRVDAITGLKVDGAMSSPNGMWSLAQSHVTALVQLRALGAIQPSSIVA